VKPLEIKAADCSSDTLVTAALKCGFVVKSSKHFKVKTVDGKFVTTIPMHRRLKRELVEGVVERFNQFGVRKVIAK